MRRLAWLAAAALAGALVIGLAVVYAAGTGAFGERDGPGSVTEKTRPPASVARGQADVQLAAQGVGVARPKQVLFGDLHVHTTISLDAFVFSLPLMRGEGAHPPADACDFARFCSALDFWSINDHDFSITPEDWSDTISSIRSCNEVGGEGPSPDTVAFLGWEWTQVGASPDDHYGHKNVVMRETDDEHIPARPITALTGLDGGGGTTFGRGLMALSGGGRMHTFARFLAERSGREICDADANVRDLQGDCVDYAPTPEVLFRKLDEWGHEALVIPHGTTWGFYTPPASRWDKQLAGAMHDPKRQTLLEVYSGHGDSEVYRDWKEIEFAADGTPTCPAPRPDYEPTCWRAGEVIRARCAEDGESAETCEQRAVAARAHAAAAGVSMHLTVPGSRAADFLDSGQCRDCRTPAFNYRPGGAAQYILALGNFDGAAPRHFRFGFIGSSDNHYGRPGTGYKEVGRRGMTESLGGDIDQGNPVARMLVPPREEPASESRAVTVGTPGFQSFETERQTSFFTTGGLVGLHAEGRDRAAIWDALLRKEVFATSGPRMLIWFDLLNAPGTLGAPLAMGGETKMSEVPIFQVRAVGSFEQLPGCPDYATSSLTPERLAYLCMGECYHPSDQRRLITRIDIVRIRPQQERGEDVGPLIEDPWRSFACEPDRAGCVATFTDPEFATAARGAVYYARAFEEPKPAINGGNLRCERDAEGNCTKIQPCPGPEGNADQCLSPVEPRAWSSPIYVDFARP
jgi:hypothetical protein